MSWALVFAVLVVGAILAALTLIPQTSKGLTLATLKDSADLGVKLAAIVAAILALNFFSLEPDLKASVVCESAIDKAAVRQAYQEANEAIPGPVEQLLITGQAGRATGQSIFLSGNKCAPAVQSFTLPFSLTPQATSGQTVRPRLTPTRTRVTPTRISDLFGTRATPLTGLGINVNPQDNRVLFPERLTAAELAFATQAIDKATSVTANVTVANIGEGDASDVQVSAPPAFEPKPQKEPFDLASGDEDSVRFLSAAGERRPAGGASLFRPFGDTVKRVDDEAVWAIAAALACVLLYGFGRAVVSPPAPG